MMNDQTELTMFTVSSSINNNDSSKLMIKSLSSKSKSASASAQASDKAFEKPKIMIMNNKTKMQNCSKISSSKNNNNVKSNANNDNNDSVVNDINNACAVSNLVDRVCEDSVGSDVSALTDVFSIKNGDNNEFVSSISSQSLSSFIHSTKNNNNNKNSSTFKSVVCAPEPPMIGNNHLVSLNLTDIESETTPTTTPTTISNDHRENISLCSNNNDNNNKKKRSVSFCEVQVRNYDRVLTVNPSVTSGPAVGLGWNYDADEDQHYSIENFEDSRELTRRCSMKELALPRSYREELVRSLGYTQREIASSTRQIIRLKNQRKQTIQNLHASSMEEFIEKATRKVKRVFSLPGSSSRAVSSSVHKNSNSYNNKEIKRSNKKTKQHSSSNSHSIIQNHRNLLSDSFLAPRKTSSLDQSHRLSVIVAAA
jgi:hypothetical protein